MRITAETRRTQRKHRKSHRKGAKVAKKFVLSKEDPVLCYAREAEPPLAYR
jgi:hypothetical protein